MGAVLRSDLLQLSGPKEATFTGLFCHPCVQPEQQVWNKAGLELLVSYPPCPLDVPAASLQLC